METRVNANYEIIASVPLDRTHEIVVGRNPAAAAPYVCWYCHNGNDYDTGIYCGTFRDAMEAMSERIKANLDYTPFVF